MQDASLFQQINPQFPEHEQLNCPRCDSKNTKFCYYNNYNLSQPRHYCKNCRRYWTKGGSLRNIPVGGSTRKATKRATSASKKSSSSSLPNTQSVTTVPKSEPFRSFVAENDQFRSLIFGSKGYGKDVILDVNMSSDQSLMRNPIGELQNGNNNNNNNNNGGEFSGGGEIVGDSSYWVSNNGWPDLAIYTPGSTFQ